MLSGANASREETTVLIMENRLPVGDSRRRELRDAKLTFREELLADRHRALKRVCPCNICMGENRSPRFRAVVWQHLRKYGRHPAHRGSTEGFERARAMRSGTRTYRQIMVAEREAFGGKEIVN
ncbi:hypothetical protein KC19_VG130400 [Ceratodon purpureus]|uniref:Uncharacterized protein n=1 Tax=Ceratodon purpureus TaxID=3225 RepID=A0A8T0HQ40_CERPU|nr:hypothetical protein KC19_VG130400 [Ceratodon purpureus]